MTSGSTTVLVVDDDPDANLLIATVLETGGHDVIRVYTGEEALDVVERSEVAAIVLDVMLPKMDGYEVCRRLKMDRATNLIPIIMVSALGDAMDRERGVAVGANCYLTKPFENAELLANVDRALQWRRSLEAEGVRGEVTLHVQSDFAVLDDMNDLVSSLFAHTPLPESQIERICYSVREMGKNAIEWGNRNNKALTVKITYRIDDEKVAFTIRDEGTGFDYDHLEHAASGDDPLAHMEARERAGMRPGGLGILISRGFMDRVEYNGAGNEVTLTKYYQSPPEGGTEDVAQHQAHRR